MEASQELRISSMVFFGDLENNFSEGGQTQNST